MPLRNLKNTKYIATLGILTGLIILLANTPIGYIPINAITLTIIHIPVIVGAIVLGPVAGIVLGAVFGITSFFRAAFGVEPFFAVIYSENPILLFVICMIPRIMIGVISAYLYKFLTIIKLKLYISAPVIGIIGSLTNTVLFLAGLFIARRYFEGIAGTTVIDFLKIVSAVNGLPEAGLACLLVTAVVMALKRAKLF